jgi:uncharacterized protein YbjT (DUF2867 family)
MSKLVTIFGGSGFVGRYIARRMAKEGWRVKVAVRRPNEALFVKTFGSVGQVEPVFCNIRDDALVAEALLGADAVVNCIGTFEQTGKNNFVAIQTEGAVRIARLAAAAGVGRMVHISSIGADLASKSFYSKSKARGENGITEHFSNSVILRPSIIFGPEDQFFNRFAAMSKISPFLPLIGAQTKFQPVFVDDVALAAVHALTGSLDAGIYELGGPEVGSFEDLMQRMLTVIKRKRITLNIPFFAARIMAWGFDLLQRASFGIFKNGVVTSDQVKSLDTDNIVSGDHRTFSDIGIVPTSLDAVLPEYLWCYRPSGQFSAIKDSAKKLGK